MRCTVSGVDLMHDDVALSKKYAGIQAYGLRMPACLHMQCASRNPFWGEEHLATQLPVCACSANRDVLPSCMPPERGAPLRVSSALYVCMHSAM